MIRFAWVVLIGLVAPLVVLALTACGPAPVTLDDAPPPAPLELVPADDTIRDALTWGLSWWRDAGETRDVTIVDACSGTPGVLCVPAVWESDGNATHLGEYMPGGPRIRFAPEVQTFQSPLPYVRAVAAHELGHALGHGHVAADERENLMAPAPHIEGGTLCITTTGTNVCRDLGSEP